MIQFDDFILDRVGRELSRNGTPVKVEPKVFDLLVHLIDNRHRVVGKDDLIAQVWGKQILSDSAITRAINAARSAIGDDGKLQRLIRTSSRWGYRFVGSIETPSSTATAAMAIEATDRPAIALPDRPSIAVLPFNNIGGDPEQDYFVDGLVEEIITALSHFKLLFVIARNSSFTYKAKTVAITQVGRELGVRYVLEGSIRKSADRIRITGQLIDAVSGVHLWADRYDGALQDVFDLQDQISASVVGAIVPSLTQAEMERAKRKPISNLDAYDCYLRGLSAHWRYTKDENTQAVALFERAIELDPDFGPAHSALSAALSARWGWGWSADPDKTAADSVARAKAALPLGRHDPLVIAQAAIGIILCGQEVELADSLFEQALRLNPNELNGWLWGGWAKVALGQHATATAHLHRALRVSPLDPRIFFAESVLAFAHFFLGNYHQGIDHAVASSRHHPTYAPNLRIAMACHALSGDHDAAAALWRKLVLLSPSDRISTLRMTVFRRDQDRSKLAEAYRLAGMPE